MKAGAGLAGLAGVAAAVGAWMVMREAQRGTDIRFVALAGLGVAVAVFVMGGASKAAFRRAAELERPAPEPGLPSAWPDANDPLLQAAADTDAVAALVSLGYSSKVADAAVARARRQGLVPPGADAGQVVQAALRTAR